MRTIVEKKSFSKVTEQNVIAIYHQYSINTRHDLITKHIKHSQQLLRNVQKDVVQGLK